MQEQLNKKKYWIIALLVVIVLVKAGYSYYQDRSKSAMAVQSVQVVQGPIVSSIAATGTIYSLNTVRVYAKSAGLIKDVTVKENDIVTLGQPLLHLDDGPLQEQIVQSQLKLKEATAKFELMTRLLKDGAVAAQQITAARLEQEAAKASYEAAVAALNNAVVPAPLSGLVVGKPIAAGQSILPGQETFLTLMTIADLSQLEIEAKVEEDLIAKVAVGQAVTFTVKADPDQSFTGSVTSISPKTEIHQGKVFYPVMIEVDPTEELLRPAMLAQVSLLVGSKESTLLVPLAAVKENNGLSFVQMIVNGQPVNQAVKIGLTSDSMAEVLSGVKKGDEVLITQPANRVVK